MIAMSDRRKSIKMLMSERKEKFGIKLAKFFISKCKKKLALCDKGLYYTIRGNGPKNMTMEMCNIIMNIMMMTLI